MSSAFVKESEEQWLHDIQPTLPALIVYLTRENNGIRVYEKKNYIPTSLLVCRRNILQLINIKQEISKDSAAALLI